jgi:alpha-beta hydrolase superfamily lysophospholipase
MNPFYFGSSSRRLFGLYSPAERKRSPGRAIVLCNPWGREYEWAHRSLRLLGAMLSGAGFDVLRFDYYGSGDAAGEPADATLAGWEGDIQAAIEEIKDTAGATRVALAGRRLGATLAANVAVRNRAAVQELVLWDPVVNGDAYIQELWNMPPDPSLAAWHLAARPAEAGGGHELQGFPLTETLAREIRALDLLGLVPALPDRTLCVASEDRASYASLRSALKTRPKGPLPFDHMPSPPASVARRDLGAGAVPVQLLQRIKEWLG